MTTQLHGAEFEYPFDHDWAATVESVIQSNVVPRRLLNSSSTRNPMSSISPDETAGSRMISGLELVLASSCSQDIAMTMSPPLAPGVM